MDLTIDTIFKSNSYRYIPVDLRNEWRDLYNYNTCGYYDTMIKGYYHNPVAQIDVYNEKYDRINRVLAMIEKFEYKLKTVQPLYNSDKKYNKKIKNELLNSMLSMKTYLNNMLYDVTETMGENDVPVRTAEPVEFVEHYQNDTQSKKKKTPVLIILFMIFMCYLLLRKCI